MILKDEIWGEEEINEKVLMDLINCESVQRLKRISQQGLPQEYYPRKIFSRYTHSIGVLIVLRRIGADIKTQIAGLIHDVSHTAFSHVVDWVLGDPTKDDYQDNSHLEIVKNSEIPEILGKYGFNYLDFVETSKFPLLDKNIPALCADRFDYALREIMNKEFLTYDEIEQIKNSLTNFNENMVFNSVEAATKFGKAFARCQNEIWNSEKDKARYHILSEILREAIKNEVISKEDFKKTDDYVINKLVKSASPETAAKLAILSAGFTTKPAKPDQGIVLKAKLRYLDPEVLINGKFDKLSIFSKQYEKFIHEQVNKHIKDKRIIITKL